MSQAFFNAAIEVWSTEEGESEIWGCHFHFKQCCTKKINEVGLKKAYIKNPLVRKLLKQPQVLAFVPPLEVVETFESLNDSLADLQPTADLVKVKEFYDYFESNFVGFYMYVTTGRGARSFTERVYKEPRFKIKWWNCFDRIELKIPRTNNFVEGWHNGFQKNIKNTRVHMS